MDLTIDQTQLAALLSRVVSAVERRNTIPILANVLLSAKGNTLTATGTDMDVEVTTTADAEVTEQGSTTVSAAMLQSIVVKLAKGKPIQLTSDGLNLRIQSGRSDINLAALPISDFPTLATSEYKSEFTASQHSVKRLFDLSAFAMSTEEARYYLQGVYLHSYKGNARAVSTDGHRLAQIDSDVVAEFPGVIVPRKTVGLIKGLLDDGDAKISISETKIKFDLGHTIVVSKVIDGTFPDYTRIIPSSSKTTVTVSAHDVKQAASLVSLVSAEKARAVKVTVGGDTLSLQVRSGVDVATELVDYDWSGEPVELGVNAKYLAEILQACNGDQAVMKFQGACDPIVICPAEDDQALFVVMSMRT